MSVMETYALSPEACLESFPLAFVRVEFNSGDCPLFTEVVLSVRMVNVDSAGLR